MILSSNEAFSVEGDARLTRQDEISLTRIVLTVGTGDAAVKLSLRGRLKIPNAQQVFGNLCNQLKAEGLTDETTTATGNGTSKRNNGRDRSGRD